MRKKLTAYGFAFPAVVGFALFYLVPVGIMLWYSVSFGIGKREFVGLKNFEELLQNEMFWLATKNTVRFLVISVPAILVISLAIALLLQQVSKHSQSLRTSYFYPMLMPIASTVLFVRALWGENGIIGEDWINSPNAFWILLILYIWKFFGYHVLILYARLQLIPKEYYECANLCGVGACRSFIYITMPQIMPVFLFNVVLAIMNAFKCYREAFMIGGNYPNESIYLLQHFINNNFQNLNYQKISTAAVLLLIVFVICMVIGLATYYFIRGREDA